VADSFDEALAAAVARWMGSGGVVAVAQGEIAGEPTIDLWTSGAASDADFPERFRGFRVRVHDAGGPFQAQDAERE
jgi:hypothetical protein